MTDFLARAQEIQEALQSDQSLSKFHNIYPSICSSLFKASSNVDESIIDSFFDYHCIPMLDILRVILNNITDSPFSSRIYVYVVTSFFHSNDCCLRAILSNINCKSSSNHQIVKSIFTLVHKLNNISPSLIPFSLSRHILYSKLASIACDLAFSDQSFEPVCALIFSRIALLGESELIWSFLLDKQYKPSILSLMPSNSIPPMLLSCLAVCGSSTLTSKDIRNLIASYFKPVFVNSENLALSICRNLLIVQTLQPRLADILILAVLDVGLDFSLRLLYSLASVFGASESIYSTLPSQHIALARSLIRVITGLVNCSCDISAHSSVSLIINGISIRLGLDSSLERNCGLHVAEAFSLLLDPSRPLMFDKFDPDDEMSKEMPMPTSVKCIDCMLTLDKDQWLNDTIVSVKKSQMPPAEMPLQSPDFATPIISKDPDSDDEFVPISLHDDTSDLSKVKPPRYLRTLLDYLRKKDSADHLEVALNSASGLIHSAASELPDMAVSIAKTLLYLQDNFNIDKFLELRAEALVALVVNAPTIIVPYFTEQFYADNYTIRDRSDLLRTLNDGATLLSTVVPTKVVKASTKSLSKPVGKTRRFHTIAKQQQVLIDNQFANIAGMFFFPLIAKIDSKFATDLFSSFPTLLSQLIFTLSSFIYHSVPGLPTSRSMVKSLVQLLLVMRFHKDPGVRRSIIYSFANIISSSNLTSDVCQTEINDMANWLMEAVQNDANPECRKISLHALSTLKDSLQ